MAEKHLPMTSNVLLIDGLNASWHTDPVAFEHLVAGRVVAVNATIAANHDLAWTVASAGRLLSHIRQNADRALLVRTVDDIHRAFDTNRVGYILGLQDTVPLGDEPAETLPAFRELGVRCIQLTYNFQNIVGCGCQCEKDTGLTDIGRDLVLRMNEAGVLIDLSHCGPRTSEEAVEASRLPVAITHSNLNTTMPHARNKSPELVKEVARRGGVIGAVAFPPLFTTSPEPSVDHYVRAIDDLVELVGVDHVGLGPDFMEAMPAEVAATVLAGLPAEARESFSSIPPVAGFASPEHYPNLVDALGRGYSAAETAAIAGGNWLRLYERVWREFSVDGGGVQ